MLINVLLYSYGNLATIDGNLVIFETRYYYYFLPSFQKKVGNTITKYLVLKNY